MPPFQARDEADIVHGEGTETVAVDAVVAGAGTADVEPFHRVVLRQRDRGGARCAQYG